MSHRTIKRVPLDYDWPLNKVWQGYLLPDGLSCCCPFCKGDGRNDATRAISDSFYNFEEPEKAWHDKITQEEVDLLVKERRLWDWTDAGKHPTAEEVNAAQHKRGFMGHDGFNQSILVRYRAQQAGVYGKCKHCKGEGTLYRDDEARQQVEDWTETEPPEGPGWQLWETVSEGSPISPVFSSPEELARWCADNAWLDISHKTSYETWLRMIQTEDGVDTGSMLVAHNGYFGAVANQPEEQE